jgi:hypothetical protein
MTHPPVGLLALALPLLMGSASVDSSRSSIGFARHVQIEESSPALSADGDNPKTKVPSLLVKLTPVQTEPQYNRLSAALDSASHQAIGGIPGVTVIGDDDDETALAKKSRKTVVVLAGKLQDLVSTKEGDEVVFRAQVEYIIYRVPDRDIAAVVDGAAKARISAVQVNTKESRQQVEDDVAAAAIESAARRAPAALMAISRR